MAELAQVTSKQRDPKARTAVNRTMQLGSATQAIPDQVRGEGPHEYL
jgi:hypothetical protein